MKLDQKIKNFIKNHAEKTKPKECCGFIVLDNLKNIECIEAKNIAEEDFQFMIDPLDFFNIKNKYFIEYIYHSHTDKKCKDFSNLDIICSKNLMKDLILYIIDIDIFKIYKYKTGEVVYG